MRLSHPLGVELPARLKGLLAISVPLLALASLTLSMRVFQAEHRKADEQIRRSIAVEEQLLTLLPKLGVAEGAIRSYLLQGKEELLDPYKAARTDLLAGMEHLEQTLRSDPSRSQRLSRLRPLIEHQLEILSNLRRYAALPGFATATPPAELLAESDQVMNQIRQLLAEMQQFEDQRLTLASSVAVAAQNNSDAVVLGTVVIGFLGGILAVWLLMRSVVTSERLRAQATVQASQEKLELALESAKSHAADLAISEQALRNQKTVLESVLEGLSDGVAVITANGDPLLCNTAASRLFEDLSNVPAGQWVERYGLSLPDLTTACPSAELSATRATRGEEVRQQILFVARSHHAGGLWVRMSAFPLWTDVGVVRGAVVVFTDITVHQRHQDSLARAKDEAERANQAKSEFVSRMSHELRTPLNAILGFAQLLDMARLKPAHRDSVGQILKAGRHLLTLINEVLDISRIESGKLSLSPEPVLASDVVREALALVQPQAAERHIRIDSEAVAGSTLFLRADRQRLKQVLINLLSNAIKYNREGGMVTIACQASGEGKIRLMVSDTGSGIPADKLDRLFSPFERLGAEQSGIEGTGIGLAFSKRLTEAMGGVLGVESQAGAGSTFFIEMPGAQAPIEDLGLSHSGQLAAAAAAVAGSAHPTVLCIEDNPSNLQLIERILACRPEIRLLTALHGLAGIKLAQQHIPSLILLDVHLPDIDGKEVLLQLKADSLTAAIPVIVVSADATHRQETRLREAGARDYLTKPIDVPSFLEKVDEVLQHAAIS
jgi:signal transduction histidine kinase/CHASE3 domain sensor protein/ActR/RegA family two-component response regulator